MCSLTTDNFYSEVQYYPSTSVMNALDFYLASLGLQSMLQLYRQTLLRLFMYYFLICQKDSFWTIIQQNILHWNCWL